MTKVVDCRGLACPQPVIRTKQALEETERVTVIVDNPAARENVARFGESQGAKVAIEEKKDGIYITVERSREGKEPEKTTAAQTPGRVVIVIPSNQMGRGDEELGHILIRSFFHTITELSNRPDTLIFFNTGVKLTVENSEVLDDLKTLERYGIGIIACGTCLDYFGLKDKIAVGQISNMYTITETMLAATRLVTI